MATSMEDDDLVEKDDYYAWLGLSKTATKEEINNAFRKMSRVYHPDKHQSEERKEKAEALFTKIKKAHEVLADAHKRSIYDTTGIKGLETEGWEVVPRTKTPQEILEEFERLQRAKEEQKLQQRTNPKGTFSVGVDATDIFDRYDAFSLDEQLLPAVEMTEMSISQSVECPLTTRDTAVVSGSMSSRNGKGSGRISVALRRLLTQEGWAEIELAAGDGASIALRGFRTLWQRGYGTMSGTLLIAPNGDIRPGYNLMVAHQLDRNLQGRLSFSGGIESAMNTMIVWDHGRHHLALVGQLGIPSCFAAIHYTNKFREKDFKLKGSLRVGTFGALAEYGCEKKVTQFSYVGASIVVGVPVGVSLKLRLSRGQQTFLFPIHLSETISPAALLYGTVVPLTVYFIVKRLVVDPYLRQQKDKELLLKKEANAQRMSEKQHDARTAVELMRETVERSYEVEESRSGLCIRSAVYGKLQGGASELHRIDVRIPLQGLVKDSRLVLPDTTQLAELLGFYDPCVGEEKQLSVTYEFRRQRYSCVFKENERIVLPSAVILVLVRLKVCLLETETDLCVESLLTQDCVQVFVKSLLQTAREPL